MLLYANNASEWTGPTGNNTYLLRDRPSILIDAGVGDTRHLDAIEAALAGAHLDLVLITQRPRPFLLAGRAHARDRLRRPRQVRRDRRLVARIYPNLSPSLRSAAEDTVRAHLAKLAGA